MQLCRNCKSTVTFFARCLEALYVRVVRKEGPQLSLIDLPGVTHNADQMHDIHEARHTHFERRSIVALPDLLNRSHVYPFCLTIFHGLSSSAPCQLHHSCVHPGHCQPGRGVHQTRRDGDPLRDPSHVRLRQCRGPWWSWFYRNLF